MVAASHAHLGRLEEGRAFLETLGAPLPPELRFISLFRDPLFESLFREGLALMDADL